MMEDISSTNHPDKDSMMENIDDQLNSKIKTEFQDAECSSSEEKVKTSAIASTSSSNIVKEIGEDKKSYLRITDLPQEVLKTIFQYLYCNDLVNVSKVCTKFELATMDTMVWKQAALFVDDTTLYHLTNMPYLHTISGIIYDGDGLLDSLMNNVLDLRQIDSDIFKNISLGKFQTFIEKFKNLEHIILCNTVPHYSELIITLNTCSNLKSIFLYHQCKSDDLAFVYKVIGDGFPALRTLHVRHFYDGEDDIDGLSEMLKKKINQLTNLAIQYEDVHPEVLKTIFKSTALKKLELIIRKELYILLNMGGMTGLKSLSILVWNFLPKLTSREQCYIYEKMIFPPNIEFLNIEFCHTEYPTKIIKKAVQSLPFLRVLEVSKVNDPDIDSQLENISNIKNMHTVCLSRCPTLTARGVENIMKCKNLKKIDIRNVAFRHETYEYLKGLKYLGEVFFLDCALDQEKVTEAISTLEYVTDVAY